MDPFVATIIKQGALLGIGVGVLAFAIFFFLKMASLQHVMTLRMVPPSLP